MNRTVANIIQCFREKSGVGASLLQKLGHKQPLCKRVLAALSISNLHLLPPTRDPRPSGRSLFLDLQAEASYDILLSPSNESTRLHLAFDLRVTF